MQGATFRMRIPAAVLGVLALTLVCGCGLLGIDLFPEPEINAAQFYTVPFFCNLDENGNLVRSTTFLLHNPEEGEVTIFRRAAGVDMEADSQEPSWRRQALDPGQSARLDCDAMTRMLSDDPSTSFKNEFEAGSSIQGFITVGVESGSDIPRLDALAQYEEPDGSLRIELIEPTLVEVTSWPPIVAAD